MPNVAVKASLKVVDAEYLLFADLFSLKTRKNLEEIFDQSLGPDAGKQIA